MRRISPTDRDTAGIRRLGLAPILHRPFFRPKNFARRWFLAAVALVLSGPLTSATTPPPEFGADPFPGGQPLGGGAGYSAGATREQATHRADSLEGDSREKHIQRHPLTLAGDLPLSTAARKADRSTVRTTVALSGQESAFGAQPLPCASPQLSRTDGVSLQNTHAYPSSFLCRRPSGFRIRAPSRRGGAATQHSLFDGRRPCRTRNWRVRRPAG